MARAIRGNDLFTLSQDFEQENASKRITPLAVASFFCCGFSRLTSTLGQFASVCGERFGPTSIFADRLSGTPALRTMSPIQHVILSGDYQMAMSAKKKPAAKKKAPAKKAAAKKPAAKKSPAKKKPAAKKKK